MAVHLAALDGKDHRRAVAETDQLGGLQIFREMYIEPGFGNQAVFQDAVHIFSPVPWYKSSGGSHSVSSTSTGTEWPWLARIFVLLSLKA